MTNNIEKLYELANITCKDLEFCESCIYLKNNQCISKKEFVEDCLSFTPEKQLELIKYFSENIYCIELSHNGREFEFYTYSSEIRTRDKDFSQALASFIYYKWKDLTDEQREEIKRILE